MNDKEGAGEKVLAFSLLTPKQGQKGSSSRERPEMTPLQFMTLVLVMVGIVWWLYVPYILLYGPVVLGSSNL